MADDEVTAVLNGIRQRAEVTERAGYRIGEDACLLLSVVDEVLKLAAKLEPQAPSPSALEEDRMWIRQQCADMIREAISRALLSKEPE